MYKQIVIFIVLASLFGGDALAQNIDSLQLALKNAKHDTTRVNALNELGHEISDQAPDSALALFAKAQTIAESNLKNLDLGKRVTESFKRNLAFALNNIGLIYSHKGDIPRALEYYGRSLKMLEEIEDKKGIATSLNNIGMLYKQQGDIPKALEYYGRSLEIREEIGDKGGIATSLNNIGSIYYGQGNIPKALEYLGRCLKMQEEKGDKKGIANSLNNIGMMYKQQGDIPKALEYLVKGLKMQEEILDKGGIATSLNNIALIYNQLGDIPKALEYNLRSLKVREEIGEKGGIAMSLNNIAGIYRRQGDTPRTMEYLLGSLKLFEEIGDKKGITELLNNIGKIYEQQGDIPKALEYHGRSLKMREEIGDKKGIATSLNNIGAIYNDQGDIPKALEYYGRSLEIREEIGDKEGIANSICNIGTIHLKQGDYSRAETYLSRSMNMSRELGYPENIRNAAENLSKLYKETNRHELALENHELFIQMRDSINNIETQKATIKQQTKYEFEKKELALKKEAELSALKYEYEKKQAAARTEKEKQQLRHEEELKRTQIEADFAQRAAALEAEQQRKQALVKAEQEKKDALRKAEQEKKDAIATQELQRQKLVRNGFMGGFAVVLIFAGVVFTQRNRISKEKQRSEKLLLNILPSEVAEELKIKGSAEAQLIDHVTVLFTDFKGFTQLSENLSPKQLVADLNVCFSAFDHICAKHGIEKIKTIGDAYMAAGGLPTPNSTHATDTVNAAIEMAAFVAESKARKEAVGLPYFEIRIGIHTGPVVAGIVGVKKFQYDIWGDTVNTASRMESSGEVGRVNISETTYELVKDQFSCTYRGEIEAKGKGKVKMYFVG